MPKIGLTIADTMYSNLEIALANAEPEWLTLDFPDSSQNWSPPLANSK